MKEYKYLKEEFHRGKWQPLMVDRKGKQVQGYAKITEEQAYWMNRNKDAYKVRYVLESSDSNLDIEELRNQYEEKFGEKPHHATKAETIKKKLEEVI